MRKTNKIILGIFLLSIAIGAYFYPSLPEQVASHWDAGGQVNGYMSKFWGTFLTPLIMVGVWLLFLLIPKIDPLKRNIEKFRKYYDSFIILIVVFFFYIFLLTLAWNIGLQFNMSQALIPALGVFFYYIGALMKHMKRNWFMGIRTPWTLSSDIVWDKTHQLAGKLFKLLGVIIIIGIFFPGQLLYFILIPTFLIVIYIMFYSYFEYKKIGDKK